MGLFDRFKKASYLGVTAAELGSDFDEVIVRLVGQLTAQQPIIADMGALVMCRSPVLVIADGKVQQPAALLPKPMLSRFWSEPGIEMFDDPLLVPLVAGFARALATSDELARSTLRDTEDVYVDKEAPILIWPDQDKRLRIASLVLADVVRKLAADLSSGEIKASYGFGDATSAALMRMEMMKAEEAPWYTAALAG
jgi:hypothetical protein